MQKHCNNIIKEIHMASALNFKCSIYNKFIFWSNIFRLFLLIDGFAVFSLCACVCLCLHAFVFMFVYVFCRVNKAQSQPRQKRMPASRPSFDCLEPEDSNGGWSPSAAPSSSPSTGEAHPVYLYKASRSSSPKNKKFPESLLTLRPPKM